MCASALARVGMGEIIFGALNDKFGGCGTAVDVITGKHCPKSARHHAVPCTGGVMMDEAVQLLREFYSRGNVRAPRPQRPIPPEWKSGRASKRVREGGEEDGAEERRELLNTLHKVGLPPARDDEDEESDDSPLNNSSS